MLDFRHLDHLVALADELHFARAADRVHLSQPAFSRSIQAIERAVGMRLFDREAGGVKPTSAGQYLVERARALLFEARNLARDVDIYRDGLLGDIAFGAGPFPAATLMPRVLPELRRLHPQVNLRVEVSSWNLLLDRLAREDIEFFVSEVRDLPGDRALDIRSIGHQRGRFYVRAGHELAARRCSVEEMWAFGVVATRLPQAVRVAMGKLLRLPAGQALPLSLECDDFTILRAVALSSDSVLGATDAAARADVEAGLLVAVDLQGLPPLFAEMGLVYLRHRTPSPMAQRAFATIERVAAEVNA
jgi:DNA-binding transcriptional LysR family regulator